MFARESNCFEMNTHLSDTCLLSGAPNFLTLQEQLLEENDMYTDIIASFENSRDPDALLASHSQATHPYNRGQPRLIPKSRKVRKVLAIKAIADPDESKSEFITEAKDSQSSIHKLRSRDVSKPILTSGSETIDGRIYTRYAENCYWVHKPIRDDLVNGEDSFEVEDEEELFEETKELFAGMSHEERQNYIDKHVLSLSTSQDMTQNHAGSQMSQQEQLQHNHSNQTTDIFLRDYGDSDRIIIPNFDVDSEPALTKQVNTTHDVAQILKDDAAYFTVIDIYDRSDERAPAIEHIYTKIPRRPDLILFDYIHTSPATTKLSFAIKWSGSSVIEFLRYMYVSIRSSDFERLVKEETCKHYETMQTREEQRQFYNLFINEFLQYFS